MWLSKVQMLVALEREMTYTLGVADLEVGDEI